MPPRTLIQSAKYWLNYFRKEIRIVRSTTTKGRASLTRRWRCLRPQARMDYRGGAADRRRTGSLREPCRSWRESEVDRRLTAHSNHRKCLGSPHRLRPLRTTGCALALSAGFPFSLSEHRAGGRPLERRHTKRVPDEKRVVPRESTRTGDGIEKGPRYRPPPPFDKGRGEDTRANGSVPNVQRILNRCAHVCGGDEASATAVSRRAYTAGSKHALAA